MPTTDRFTATLRGNGLPFCPPKRDVSSYSHWTTFSGTNKDNFSGQDLDAIAQDLRLAIKWYWNLYGGIGLVKLDQQSPNVFYEETNFNHTTVTPAPQPELLPINRSCNRELLLQSSSPGWTLWGDIESLYNGSTDNYENFIGYAAPRIRSLPNAFQGVVFGFQTRAILRLSGSIVFAENETNTTSTTLEEIRVGYTEIPAIDGSGDMFNFVSLAEGRTTTNGLSFSLTVDAENANVEAEAVASSPGNPTFRSDVRLDSLDFYTY